MPARIHRATWTRTLVASTVTLAAGCLVAVAALLELAWRLDGGARWLVLASALLVAGAVAASAALAPRAFAVSEAGVEVRRLVGTVHIPRAAILAAEVMDDPAGGGAIRLLGVHGLFGYFGLYRSLRLGRFRLHATRPGPAVVLRTTEGLVALTPDRPAEFAGEVTRLVVGAAEAAIRR